MQPYVKRVWIAVGAVAAVVLLLSLVGYLHYGVLIIFAGILLGVFLSRLGTLLASLTGFSYGLAYGIVVVLFLAIGIGTIAFMGTRIAMEATQFVEQFSKAASRFEQTLRQQPWWQQVSQWSQDAADALSSRQAFAKATSAAYVTLSALVTGVLVLFLGFYFAVQPDRYRNGFLSLIPEDHRHRVDKVLSKIVERLWYWILGRLVGMLAIGVGTTVGLWLLGVPLPIPLGVLAGLLNFIPNFGPLIALGPAVLFALQQGGSTALYVVLFYLAIQMVESYFLTPLIDQHQIAFPPGLTLSVQLLFGLLAGLLGLLLAVPLTVVVAVLLREFFVRDILEAEPVRSG